MGWEGRGGEVRGGLGVAVGVHVRMKGAGVRARGGALPRGQLGGERVGLGRAGRVTRAQLRREQRAV